MRGGSGRPTSRSASPASGAVLDLDGLYDSAGYELHATQIAVADEIAGAAQLVMGKIDGIPAAVVRGLRLQGDGRGQDLIMPRERDLFRERS